MLKTFTLEPARRLLDLWAYLPAFRAAAETEHLPSAAAKLHLTPSALSRSVRLLEEQLGQKLFDRTGRRLVLNQQGRGFLVEVRTAMRIVDEGVGALLGGDLRGTVRLSLPPDFSEWLAVPTMRKLADSHPELRLELVSVGEQELAAALHQGDLDAAVTSAAIATRPGGFDLAQELLVELRYAVYARPGHVLATGAACKLASLERHGFVSAPGDGFPLLDRRRATIASDLRAAAALASASELLVCLPTAIGSVLVERDELVRLRVALPTRGLLYLAYRRPVSTHARTEALLAALRTVLPRGDSGDQR